MMIFCEIFENLFKYHHVTPRLKEETLRSILAKKLVKYIDFEKSYGNSSE